MLSNGILLKWCPAFQDLVGQRKIYKSFFTTRFQVFNTLVQTSSAWWWVVTFFLIGELRSACKKASNSPWILSNLHFTLWTEQKMTSLPTKKTTSILLKNTLLFFFWKKTTPEPPGTTTPFAQTTPGQNAEPKRSFQVSRTSSATGEDAIGGSLTVRTTGGICWDDLKARVEGG